MANRFPDDKKFAFSVFDDTDCATLENVGPVYRFMAELGLRTTKSVWPLATHAAGRIGGDTLQAPPYLAFILDLKRQGFEIGFHNARNYDSPREVTERGLEEFRRLIGHYPVTHCNHFSNCENIYWGARRLSSPGLRLVYNLATRFSKRGRFQGHVEGSPFFWGDLCAEHIRYVRNFVFEEINLDRINPTMPYRDPSRPHVNAWFSSCQGGSLRKFCYTLREANQDRLEEEGGVCIMYTHFGSGFCRDGRLDPDFERLVRRLAGKNGWFVPVGTLLDHLSGQRILRAIPERERAAMERRFLMEKLRDRNPLRRLRSKLQLEQS